MEGLECAVEGTAGEEEQELGTVSAVERRWEGTRADAFGAVMGWVLERATGDVG